MKKRNTNSLKVFFIVNALLLLFSLNTSDTFAEFYVIAGSRGVGTEIKALPYTISSSGFYYITKDLSCAADTHGITVNADNVTLDLMGFSLVGGTGAYNGIYMYERNNVEIRNGTVMKFPSGGINEAKAGNGKGHRIINIRAKDNGGSGIALMGYGHLVEGCTASYNVSIGIHAEFHSTITGNTSFLNTNNGINVGPASTITGNTCFQNSFQGIFADVNSTVTGNTSYANNSHGIFTCSGSTVTGNTSNLNGGSGINAGEGSTIIGNTCGSNTGYGIYLGGYDLVDQNTAYNNTAGNMSGCIGCQYGTNVAP